MITRLGLSSPAFVAVAGGGPTEVMTGLFLCATAGPYSGVGGPGIGTWFSRNPNNAIITVIYNGYGPNTTVSFPYGSYVYSGPPDIPVVVDGNGINGMGSVTVRVEQISVLGALSFTGSQANFVVAGDPFNLISLVGQAISVYVTI